MNANTSPAKRRKTVRSVPVKVKPLTRSAKKGVWERGYRKHTYWVADKKFGEIALCPRGESTGGYRWSCPLANLRGSTNSLPLARGMVENIVHTGAYQPDLFDFEGDAPNAASFAEGTDRGTEQQAAHVA